MIKARSILAHITVLNVVLCLPLAAHAVTTQWTGAVDANWNTTTAPTNWSAGIPTGADLVLFSTGSGSAANLATNNDIPGGASMLGISNTLAPLGNISISGNKLTIGASGIAYGQGANAATKNLSVNTDVVLGASQNWTMGGVGLTMTIGASSANTVTMNGNTLTLQSVGNVETMIINSSLVNGTGASALNFSPSASTSKTQIRLLGTNTFTGGSSITGANNVIQLGTSSAAGSGPLGTGNITLISGSTNLEAYNTVDSTGRTLDNTFTLGSGTTLTATTSTGQTSKSLTLNGAISSPTGNRTILVDAANTSAGSGDLIFNGNITLGSSGVGGGTLTTGLTGGTASFQPGKITYNGNILDAAGVTSGAILSVANGSPTTFVTQVALNGQNTYSGGTTIGAGSGIIYLGSSSAGPAGAPTSGPLGKGALTFSNGGNTPRIEAVGTQTVGNNVVLTSSGIVQGTSDLTLSGTISAAGGLAKNGAGKLTLTGTNSFAGNVTVNAGTVSVPVIAANGTNQPLGTATTAITVGNASNAGTLEYTGAAATTLSRQITAAAGGTTIRATAATGTGLTLNATTAVAGGANPVTFDGAGNITVSTPITGTTGATVTKTGGGTLSLNAANTYSGGTTVTGGVVSVNNTTGSGTGSGNVTVGASGTLQGTGFIAGSVLSSGVVSPGNSIGVLTLDGTPVPSFSLLAGSYKYEIDSNAVTADRTDVRGNLNITAGTALSASDLGSSVLATGTKFTLINYGGSWDGGIFNGLPNYSTSLVIGLNRFGIKYNDTSGGTNFGGGTFGAGSGSHWVTITAVPEASTFVTIGLGGIFAIAAVWMGKRRGVSVFKI